MTIYMHICFECALLVVPCTEVTIQNHYEVESLHFCKPQPVQSHQTYNTFYKCCQLSEEQLSTSPSEVALTLKGSTTKALEEKCGWFGFGIGSSFQMKVTTVHSSGQITALPAHWYQGTRSNRELAGKGASSRVNLVGHSAS